MMIKLPSRLRRLDDALADIALDGDPMLLSELDGFLAGLLLCPDTILPAVWLPYVWGTAEVAPFDDPLDTQWFVGMVLARQEEIRRDLERDKLQPIFDVDERSGEALWEIWIEGLDAAWALHPDSGRAVAESGEAEVVDAFAYLTLLTEIAANESSLTSIEINAIGDDAPDLIGGCAALLYAWRVRQGGALPTSGPRSARVGRNDPCPCGSGKKHKRCCGAN